MAAAIQRLLEWLGAHARGVDLAMIERIEAFRTPLFIGMDDERRPMRTGKGVTKGEQFGKFAGRIDMQKRKLWSRRKEGPHCKVGKHGGTLACGKQHHRVFCLRHRLTQDVDRLCLEPLEVRKTAQDRLCHCSSPA